MADPTYPLYPTFAFLGFILSLIPLPWHLQAWNSGTCYFMLWSALACLNQFVNSVVWHGNALNPAPIWCDISIRILMGASVGIPAASLCINRRLYHIASIQAVSVSRSEKRRDVLIDTAICVVFPIIYIALQYVVSGHRFDILEDLGCQPALYNTLPTYFISYMWPILIGLASAVYCVLSLRSFIRRRVQFNQFLTSNKSLSASRYFRLMALATCDLMLTIPLASFVIWLNTVASPIAPWISWEDTHFGYERVDQIPAVLWRGNSRLVLAVEVTRWLTPLCGLLFFALFGFADEARRNYKIAFWAVVKPFGWKPAPTSMKGGMKPVVSIGRFVKPKPPTSTTFSSSSNGDIPLYLPSPSSASTLGSSKASTFSPPSKHQHQLAELKVKHTRTLSNSTTSSFSATNTNTHTSEYEKFPQSPITPTSPTPSYTSSPAYPSLSNTHAYTSTHVSPSSLSTTSPTLLVSSSSPSSMYFLPTPIPSPDLDLELGFVPTRRDDPAPDTTRPSLDSRSIRSLSTSPSRYSSVAIAI
ncbi:hypothetical protein ONZ45_g11738 [Pleurotus djamor]|nr:hypothetical protein ONZ45_g11738 [Pleurotus djamor]